MRDWLALMYQDVEAGKLSAKTVNNARTWVAVVLNGSIEYRLDNPNGPRLATVPIQNTGGWQSWQSRTVQLERNVAGVVHKLYLTFTGPGAEDFVNVNWFQFGTAPINPTSSGEETPGA